jgi:tight adherence protein B
MEIREDLETVVTASKTEQNLMIVMPIALIGLIKSMSPEFAANFATTAGVAATTIGVICFVAAYYVGKAVLDIKI